MTDPIEYPEHTTNVIDNNGQPTTPSGTPVNELTGDAFKAEAEKVQKLIVEKHKNKTTEAGQQAFNPAEIKLASDRRDSSRASARANEATDPNNTGTGGISAGGA